ncbi:MAG: hypothetical protein KAR40_12560 [Candidatus Sabulitectum sp.]|nr:hypothetical protein [Candidatus Sabulitectum sp.]
MSDGAVKLIKRVAVYAGALFIIAALLADITGMSIGKGISLNQIAFFITGVLLITAGLLGRRFPGCYRATAAILLNVALNTPVLGVFAPYVMWRSNPACSNYSCSIDDSGYRVTPGISSSCDAYQIFLLGGSAMWGTGVSDQETIAGHLQTILNRQAYCPVKISNLAQPAFSSTQELIELILQLRNGNVPDMVIFYDGFNEVWTAYESGLAGRLFGEREIAARFEQRETVLSIQQAGERFLRELNSWLLISSIWSRVKTAESEITKQVYTSFAVEADSLSKNVVNLYKANMSLVEVLSTNYGFIYTAVWQPSIWYGDKELTDFEKNIYQSGVYFSSTGGDSAFYDLYGLTVGDRPTGRNG